MPHAASLAALASFLGFRALDKAMKSLGFACVTSLLLAACAEAPEPLPQPDAALIERLALANTAAPATPGKLEKADRLVATVARVEPDRIAGAAEKLLAR
jgi:starvation-inducible outer membrane lipoprotein